jgi:hypothetical protein
VAGPLRDRGPRRADNEHTEAADAFVADPAPDTVIVPDVGPTQVPDLAWSSDSDTADYGASTERYTRVRAPPAPPRDGKTAVRNGKGPDACCCSSGEMSFLLA